MKNLLSGKQVVRYVCMSENNFKFTFNRNTVKAKVMAMPTSSDISRYNLQIDSKDIFGIHFVCFIPSV